MAITMSIALFLLTAAADPPHTAAQALAVSVTACETWVTETIADRDAAPAILGLGLQPEAVGPDVPGVPADIENGAVRRFRIGFPAGNAWLIVADGVPACHAGLLSSSFFGAEIDAALMRPEFTARWVLGRDEPLDAVWQRRYDREDSATLFITMTGRARPGPEGSQAQVIFSMADRGHPIAIER